MVQAGLRSKYNQFTKCPCPKTEVNIIQSHCKAFIQPMKFLKNASLHHQTGACYCTLILCSCQSPQISCGISVISGKNMSCKTCDSYHDTSMLNRIIRVKELGTYNAHILSLAIAHHVLQPLWSNNLCIIIEQKEIISIRIFCTKIVDC